MSENNNLQSEFRNLLDDSSPMEAKKESPWKDDCANRKEFSDKLTTIIENIGAQSSAVILLNGEWGTGKTYFLKSFRQELEGQKYKAIYFDAYAEDFSSDPLLAICGQLWNELKFGGDNLKKILDSFMILSKGALRYHGVDTGIIKEISDKVCRPNLFEEYAKSRKELEALKKQLSSIATRSQDEKEGEANPLVFIIDELDRCRPTFALELLERVKHLFQVPGIIFVFGANKNSLMDSVKSEYGIKNPEYLQKFFDWELTLPDAPPAELVKRYVDKLNYKILMDDFGGGEYKNMTNTFITDELYYKLMDIMGASFRQAQRSAQLFLLCLLILDSKRKAAWWHKMAAVACLTLLKFSQPDLYKDMAYRGATCEKIIAEMSTFFDKAMMNLDAHDETAVKRCRLFFYRSIYILAEGEEKKMIEESNFPQNKYISNWNAERWEVVKQNLVDRAEIVAMLENLDCGPNSSTYRRPIQF